MNKYDFDNDARFLRLLSLSFPNVAEASKEIIKCGRFKNKIKPVKKKC